MIYLVTRNVSIFESVHYKTVPFDEALEILVPLKEVQLDTETTGLDAHTKQLLTIQLGCRENQVVFDWTTMIPAEKSKLKEYLESDRLFIGWNLMFDLGFLYVNDIWPKNIWDGMIAEQLLYLGYDSEAHSFSLKSAAMQYLNYDLDKTVRGKIINVGLTEEVVIYAAGDVMHLEDIKDKQMAEIEAQGMQKALQIENAFIPSLAYFKHCGVLLDVPRWKEKMAKDLQAVHEAEQKLNDWVVDWCLNNDEHGDGTYETEYIDTWQMTTSEIQEAEGKLLKKKFTRWPQGDATGPGSTLRAYRKPMQFIKVNLQGDLFAENPFDTRPKCTINWASAQQVIPFFKKLGIDTGTFDKKTRKKKDTISKNVLKPQKGKFPIIPIFLAYKAAQKVTTTYGQNWIDAINPVTGRIHVEFHSIGTDTARVSSGGGVYKLNLQNLPHDEETRACFIAGSGNKWISADYQSQESRIIASVSQDEAMIDLFERGCGDVHSLVAYMSFPNIIPRDTNIEDIKKLYHNERQEAKGVEFAVNLHIKLHF